MMGFLPTKIEKASMYVLGMRCILHEGRYYPLRWKTFVPMELSLMTSFEELKLFFYERISSISEITFHFRFYKQENNLAETEYCGVCRGFFWLRFLSAAQLGALNKVWHNIAVKYRTLQHHLLLFAFFQLQYACEHRHQSAAKLRVMLSEGMNIFSIMDFGSEIIIPVRWCPVQWKDWRARIWLKGLDHVCNWTYYRFFPSFPLF